MQNHFPRSSLSLYEVGPRQLTEIQELTTSQNRFKQLFNAAAMPLGFVNNNGALVDINDRFVRTFGYTLDDVPTLNEWWLLAYPDPEYRQWAVATWTEAVRKTTEAQTDIMPMEYDVTCKNGEVRTMEISGTIFDDHCLATFFDITARKRATRELLLAKENWEQTFAAIGDIATIQDSDHRILQANRQAVEALGLNPEQLVGKHCYEVFHGSTAPP